MKAALLLGSLLLASVAHSQSPAPAAPAYDAELARSLGADDQGLRAYVFVILRSGPNRIPAGAERDEMFRGHFANIRRLSSEGKLAYAGPLDGVDGRRGIFILSVTDIEEARRLVAADPVIEKGEMVAEFHRHFGSAALMQVPQVHPRITRKPM